MYWLLKQVLLGPLLRVVFRPRIIGGENIPQDGPAILASNHLSFSDSIFLPLMVDRRLTFPAKMEYFTGSGVKGRLTAAFFRGTGQIPIDRTGGSASDRAMEAGAKILGDGELFGIYPEGTRSPDGKLYRGKTGVARLALETGVPVIPVAMVGTDRVQPIGKKLPRVHRVGIVVGKPMDFSRYRDLPVDRAVIRAVTDDVMYELMRLSGQEYVDEYAAVVKRRRAADLVRSAATNMSARVQAVSVMATEAGEKARVDFAEKVKEATDSAKMSSAKAREATDRALELGAARARDLVRRGAQDAPTDSHDVAEETPEK